LGLCRVSKRRLLEDVVFAWVISAAIVILAAYVSGVNPWAVESYTRADSAIYIDVASGGYRLVSCVDIPGYDPHQWCGNAGWMPGFPLLIGLLAKCRMIPREAAFLISNSFFVGCLILLRSIIEQIAPDRDNRACFLAAAVFPGGIYLRAVFPISLLVFCALLSLLLLARRRFLWASIMSAWGAFSYATGFLLAGVVGGAVLIARDASWGRRFGEAILYAAIAFSGLLAVMIMHQILVGHWNAFFLVQAKYGHGIHDPLLTVSGVWRGIGWEHADLAKMVPPLQSLIVCALVPALLGFLLVRRGEITRIEWFAAIHVFLFWVFPLVMGPGVSLTRAEANLLPLTLLMVRLPGRLQLLALIVFAALYFETSVAFFEKILV
jgi:hypothetical protein